MSDQTPGVLPRRRTPGALLDAVLGVMNSIGSSWIFVLMVIICVDAFGRTFFAHPFHGVNEVVEMSIVGIVFLQLGDATRRGRLTRSDGFFNIVKSRWPTAWRVQGAIFDGLGIVFFLIVLAGVIPEMIDAYTLNYFVGEEGLFTFPEWPIKMVIVLGCLVTMFQFVRFWWTFVHPNTENTAAPAASNK